MKECPKCGAATRREIEDDFLSGERTIAEYCTRRECDWCRHRHEPQPTPEAKGDDG